MTTDERTCGTSAAQSSQRLTPLHAEPVEAYVRPFEFGLNPGCAGRAEHLYGQLRARTETWGVGLWPDEDTEAVARSCAGIFVENFIKCPNDRLIPQDRMAMVMALNDTGDLEDVEAIGEIESEFACRIPEELFNENTTFAEFVECVKAGRGKIPPEKATADDWGKMIAATACLLLLVIGLPCCCAFDAFGTIGGAVAEGWTFGRTARLLFDVVWVGLGLYLWIPAGVIACSRAKPIRRQQAKARSV